MPKKKGYGLNKYQKKAKKVGELRLRRENIPHYLALAGSDNPADDTRPLPICVRAMCGIPFPKYRPRYSDSWKTPIQTCAPAPGTRWKMAAVPDDPRMDEIFERARQNETDKTVLNFMRQVQNENYAHKERTMLKVAAQSEYNQTGRCDFCGATGKVKTDFDTEIPDGGQMRFALVCEECG